MAERKPSGVNRKSTKLLPMSEHNLLNSLPSADTQNLLRTPRHMQRRKFPNEEAVARKFVTRYTVTRDGMEAFDGVDG